MTFTSDVFSAYARKKQRKFGRSRMKTVGASEIGQCIRKIGYLKHDDADDSNINPDHVDTWGASRRGTTFENHFFVPAMRERFGDKLLYAGGQQKTLTDGQLSATPDGLLVKQPHNILAGLQIPNIGPSGELVIECKTIDPRVNLSEPRLNHVFQAQVQLGLFRIVTKHRPDYALLVYTNASFFDDTIEFVVRYDAAIFAQARRRAAQVFNATQASDLEPEGWIGGGRECDYCQFSTACRALRGDVPNTESVTIEPQFLAELFDLATAERACRAQLEAAEAEHRAAQEKIKVALKSQSLNRVKTREMNIVWSTVVGRPSFDMPKLKEAAVAAGFNLQRFERVGQPTDRLTVQVIKQDRLVQSTKEHSDD